MSERESVVDSSTNCNQASFLVTLTRQLVPVQLEVCECSQLTQLGWDATCEANRAVSEIEGVVDSFTNCNQAVLVTLTRQLVVVQAEDCECT